MDNPRFTLRVHTEERKLDRRKSTVEMNNTNRFIPCNSHQLQQNMEGIKETSAHTLNANLRILSKDRKCVYIRKGIIFNKKITLIFYVHGTQESGSNTVAGGDNLINIPAISTLINIYLSLSEFPILVDLF